MKEKPCPCCGQNITFVRGDVIASHLAPDAGQGHRPRRAGVWCDGSGYTLDQAQRWAALSDDDRRVLLAPRLLHAKAVA